MGADVGSSSRGVTSINITPLVDVMLVLLVIFMVTASVQSAKAVPVQVPKASTGIGGPSTAIQLSIEKSGVLRMDGNLVDPQNVLRMLTEATKRDTSVQVLIAADYALEYARIVEILDMVRQAGVGKYALKIQAAAQAP